MMSGEIDAIRASELDLLVEHGWYSHYVANPPDSGINAHTHGFQGSYDHHDFQIVLPLPARICHQVFQRIAQRLASGEQFLPGDTKQNVIEDYPVMIAAAREGIRPVCRIIFPDKAGALARDAMTTPQFKRQWEGIIDDGRTT
jgi:hypothetical protein